MYRSYDDLNGMPPMIYRSPAMIKQDMREIKIKIDKVNSMLNIRELLLNILTEQKGSSKEVVTDLINILAEAREALSELSELEEELSELEEELMEVQCIL